MMQIMRISRWVTRLLEDHQNEDSPLISLEHTIWIHHASVRYPVHYESRVFPGQERIPGKSVHVSHLEMVLLTSGG